MKKSLVSIVLASCLAACLMALPASASTFVALSGQQMLDQSHAVVQGKVVDVQSSWTESGRLIVTDVKISVTERLLGNTAKTITVRTAGGEVGGLRVEAHGFPVFEMGREVILFLNASENGRYSVLGYQQGHYRVVERLDGVTLAVPQADAGVRFIDQAGRAAPAQQSVEIGAFKDVIRAAATKRGAQLR